MLTDNDKALLREAANALSVYEEYPLVDGLTALAEREEASCVAAGAEDSKRLLDILDCGTNALFDSVLASGNDSATNLHWIRKMRRDAGIDPRPAARQGEGR